MEDPKPVDGDVPEEAEDGDNAASTSKAKSRRSGSVVGAAMLGLGEVLEPEKIRTDVVIQSEVDKDDDLGKAFDLSFGALETEAISDTDT